MFQTNNIQPLSATHYVTKEYEFTPHPSSKEELVKVFQMYDNSLATIWNASNKALIIRHLNNKGELIHKTEKKIEFFSYLPEQIDDMNIIFCSEKQRPFVLNFNNYEMQNLFSEHFEETFEGESMKSLFFKENNILLISYIIDHERYHEIDRQGNLIECEEYCGPPPSICFEFFEMPLHKEPEPIFCHGYDSGASFCFNEKDSCEFFDLEKSTLVCKKLIQTNEKKWEMDEKVLKFNDTSKGISAQFPNEQEKDFEFSFSWLSSVHKFQKEGESFVLLNARYLYKVEDNTLYYSTEITIPNSISLISQNEKYLVFTDQTNKDKLDVLFYDMESLKFDNSLKREIQIELKNEEVTVKMENDEIACRTYQSNKIRSILFEKAKKVFPFTEFVVWITEEWIHNCDDDLLYSICDVIDVPFQLPEPSKQTINVFNEKNSY